jgi:hypothetical protein
MHKTNVKGKSSEVLFELMCVNMGFHCCKPIFDFMKYDYITDFGEGFKKVQIKSFYLDEKIGEYRCDLRRNNKKRGSKIRYLDGDFDILAACVSPNKWLVVPWESIKEKTEIRLSDRRVHDGTAKLITFQI